MKLSLKNIGKVKEATVEINGITVIAGENNTGKSTVSKVLFSVFNSFFDIEHQIVKERAHGVERVVDTYLIENQFRLSSRRVLSEYIVKNAKNRMSKEDISFVIADAVNLFEDMSDTKIEDEVFFENFATRLSEVLSISDDEIFQKLINDRMGYEFTGQINNIYSNKAGQITLEIKNNPLSIEVLNNEIKGISSRINLKTEAIYIDNPFVIDEHQSLYPSSTQLYDHRSHLNHKLMSGKQNSNIINEIIAAKKFDVIFEKMGILNEVPITRYKHSSVDFRNSSNDEFLNIRNLSTGMKTFLIIKILLSNGSLQPNGIIILDEPEIHLHPEWQLLFAELIVLIQKEFDMHILLNTHSPYFVRAIQVYSAKHKIADKCKYYLSHLVENEAYINDVSGDIEQIFKKLSLPFQKLDDERWQND